MWRSTEVNQDLLYEPDEHLKRDAEFPPMRGKRNPESICGSPLGSGAASAPQSAHSRTVVGGLEIPLRPRMQVSPTGSAIAEALPLDAWSGSAGVVAAPGREQKRTRSKKEQVRLPRVRGCSSLAAALVCCVSSRTAPILPDWERPPGTSMSWSPATTPSPKV
jgi:hypothetical protein